MSSTVDDYEKKVREKYKICNCGSEKLRIKYEEDKLDYTVICDDCLTLFDGIIDRDGEVVEWGQMNLKKNNLFFDNKHFEDFK